MRSKFEEKIYGQLVRKFGADRVQYEPLKLRYTLDCIYTPDFQVDGTDVIIETKGYFRPKDMRIMRAVKECNPDLDIRMLFQANNKYSKRMRYSDWAERYGFKYAIGRVPKDWFE